MKGSGSTVVLSGATATFGNTYLEESRKLINEGTVTYSEGDFNLSGTAVLENKGTFKANAESSAPDFRINSGTPRIVNTGLFEKTSGTGKMEVEANLENTGTIRGESAPIEFTNKAAVSLGESTLEGTIVKFRHDDCRQSQRIERHTSALWGYLQCLKRNYRQSKNPGTD